MYLSMLMEIIEMWPDEKKTQQISQNVIYWYRSLYDSIKIFNTFK